MKGDDAVWVVLVASLVVGYAWGRVGSWLGMPPSLGLVSTPLVTGFLSVMEGWFSALAQFDATLARAQVIVGYGAFDVVFRFATFNLQCFLLGIFFGIPGFIGWVAAYRQAGGW